MALTTLAALAYVSTAEKSYEAEAQVLIAAAPDNPVYQGLGLITATSDPTRDVQTASGLITTTEVAERVKRELGFAGPAAELLGAVTAEPVGGSQFVAVTAAESDPQEAAALANAFAKEAVKNRTDLFHDRIDERLQQLEALGEGNPDAGYDDEIRQLQAIRPQPDPTMSFATPADVPTAPVLAEAQAQHCGRPDGRSRPRHRRGVRVPRFSTLDCAARNSSAIFSGFRSSAGYHASRGARRTPRATDLSARVESRRPSLRPIERCAGRSSANSKRQGGKLLLVTGSSPSEGKTTTAINLAASLSSAGKRGDPDRGRPAAPRRSPAHSASSPVAASSVYSSRACRSRMR